MDLTNIQIIKTLSKKFNISPSPLSGQNFLIDKNILNQIVDRSDIKKNENILEIGPGFGVLTQELLKKSNNILSVERDNHLAKHLKAQFKDNDSIEILQKDILKLENSEISSYFIKNSTTISDTKNYKNRIEYKGQDSAEFISHSKILNARIHLSDKLGMSELSDSNYRIIANIPYQITGKILRKFVSDKASKPKKMHILLQKEVAQRVCASRGKMNLLGISVQLYSKPDILFNVSKSSFWPQPKVDSSFLQINNISEEPIYDISNEKKFWQVVRIGFSSPRKQLHNTLSAGLGIESQDVSNILREIGLNQKIRAQELGIDDWIKLAIRINPNSSE